MIRWIVAGVLAVSPALAQDSVLGEETFIENDVPASAIRTVSAPGANLRGLDKLNGTVTDLTLDAGETASIGRIDVTLGECRYPADNSSGEAYAWMRISDPSLGTTLFEGWMIASSPALSALDHPRYDVWVIRCTIA